MVRAKEKDRIVFLGTGGGKHIMFTQARKTGGIYCKMDGIRFVLDPGPGSLVHAQKLKLRPELWDGILLSHRHVDHSTDADALLDGMGQRGSMIIKKIPFLVAEESCLVSTKEDYPRVSMYHQKKARTHKVKAGDCLNIKGLKIRAAKADHYNITVGFRVEGSRTIGFASDGTYYRGQEKNYEGCDILVLNVLVPKGRTALIKKHMSVDEAIKLINKMKNKPKLVIIQHFSFWMLKAGVLAQAKAITDATGVKVVAAEDFMEVDLETLKTRKYS